MRREAAAAAARASLEADALRQNLSSAFHQNQHLLVKEREAAEAAAAAKAELSRVRGRVWVGGWGLGDGVQQTLKVWRCGAGIVGALRNGDLYRPHPHMYTWRSHAPRTPPPNPCMYHYCNTSRSLTHPVLNGGHLNRPSLPLLVSGSHCF